MHVTVSSDFLLELLKIVEHDFLLERQPAISLLLMAEAKHSYYYLLICDKI